MQRLPHDSAPYKLTAPHRLQSSRCTSTPLRLHRLLKLLLHLLQSRAARSAELLFVLAPARIVFWGEC